MLLALAAIAIAPAQTWTFRGEVYELAMENGCLFARTSGGIIAQRGGKWVASSRMPRRVSAAKPALQGDGAVLSAFSPFDGGYLASFWGGRTIFSFTDGRLQPYCPRPPAQGDYDFLQDRQRLYVGTDSGLFVRERNAWKAVSIGGELPFQRVHGIAKLGGEYVIGGMGGLFFGKPGKWREISKEPVRRLLSDGEGCWVLYGSGAVDRLSKGGRLDFDVLYETARRPWTSSLAISPKGTLLGGSGGWVSKGRQLAETYPPEMRGQVVTALVASGNRVFAGTQGAGLFDCDGNSSANIALPDPWVTALCNLKGHIFLSTATAGLFEYRNGRAIPVPCPSQRLVLLSNWKGRLVVGAMDGTYVRQGQSWKPLYTRGLETTCLTALGGDLWVGTPEALFRFR